MLIPILSSALGACLFLALGFSFTEVDSIAQDVRTSLVIVASFTVAFGSSFGSVGSGIEIFRKVHTAQAKRWDWVSLVISTATTVAGFAMGFAALLGATANWSEIAVIYGSLVVGTLAALDSSGDMIELGGLFGSFEERYEQWLEEKRQWESANVGVQGDNVSELEQLSNKVQELTLELESLSWPRATIADYRRVKSAMNGQSANLDMQMLKREMQKEHKRLPSARTVERWLSE